MKKGKKFNYSALSAHLPINFHKHKLSCLPGNVLHYKKSMTTLKQRSRASTQATGGRVTNAAGRGGHGGMEEGVFKEAKPVVGVLNVPGVLQAKQP